MKFYHTRLQAFIPETLLLTFTLLNLKGIKSGKKRLQFLSWDLKGEVEFNVTPTEERGPNTEILYKAD